MALTIQNFKQDLSTRPYIFTAYCSYTNLPYVTCDPESFNDQAWLFFREQDVQAFGKTKAEEKILLKAVKVERKNLLSLFGQLFAIGVNTLVWNKSGSKLEIDLTEIAKQPDYSKIEPAKRPLLNPSLELSGIYFMQEMRRPVPMEEHGDISSLNEELMANLVKAEFLAPLVPNPEEPTNVQKMMVPFVKGKDEKSYRPVCSDSLEMQHFAGKNKMAFARVPFKGLKAMMPEQADGIVINPAGFNMILPKEQLSQLIAALQEEE